MAPRHPVHPIHTIVIAAKCLFASFTVAYFVPQVPLLAAGKIIDFETAKVRLRSPSNPEGGAGNRCVHVFRQESPHSPGRDLSGFKSLPEILAARGTQGHLTFDQMGDRQLVEALLSIDFSMGYSLLANPRVFPVFRPILEKVTQFPLHFASAKSTASGVRFANGHFITAYQDGHSIWIHIYPRLHLPEEGRIQVIIVIDIYRGQYPGKDNVVLNSYQLYDNVLIAAEPEALNGFSAVLARVDRVTALDRLASLEEGALIPQDQLGIQ